MQYYKDLLRKAEFPKAALVIGILFFVLTIAWLPVRYSKDNSLSFFDWFYTVLLFLNGLVMTLTGLGYRIEKLYGKAFIQIDEQVIAVKPGVMDKAQKSYWNKIDTINYSSGKFKITHKDNKQEIISLSKIEYSDIQDIKDAIAKFAEIKNIPFKM